MYRVAWALQNSKAIGRKYEKPWENQGFAAERTGTELSYVLSMLYGNQVQGSLLEFWP
jgi:hypothetical protein